MDRLRSFFEGGGGDVVDQDSTRTRSFNQRFGVGKQSRYNPDNLYLSDDDDWGMGLGAFSSKQTSLRENDRYDGGARPGGGAFWDRSDSDGSTTRRKPRGSIDMEIESRGLQAWEQQAMKNDNIDNDTMGGDFEIGDDDPYHSNTQRRKSNDATNEEAYAAVQDDLDHLEESDNSTASNKDEVVNAYRDYLKSIRDGGFESYLDSHNEPQTPHFGKTILAGSSRSSSKGTGGEDDALERVLDIEEERRGVLYGDLYGVQDMRSASSPYNAWRAKAKALLKEEEQQRDGDLNSLSPTRRVLNKLRDKRRANSQVNGSRERNDASPKGYSYIMSILKSPLFRRMFSGCIVLVLVLLLGLSSYGGEKSNHEKDIAWDIPSAEGGGPPPSWKDPKQQPQKQPLQSGQSDAVANSIRTFDPKWYNRNSGWEGITFVDSVKFCASHEGRVPCPFELYCSGGDGSVPFKGSRPNGEQWSAISNGPNQWVQVGGVFNCLRYTDLHDHKKPDWGITGISLEHEHGAGGITQNILCCLDVHHIGNLDPFTEWGTHLLEDHVEEDTALEATSSAILDLQDAASELKPEGDFAGKIPDAGMDEQKREKTVIAAFQPIWLSKSHGWSGSSYEDGILFCESYNHMVLCPYAAYCPNGDGKPALPGSMVLDSDGEQWVPANGPMNTWVQIGRIDGDERTRCTLHHDLYGERPEWGVDGSRTELKQHIMCCKM